ncbi:MAG: hypothetical protein PQJ61_02170 [Spirochaetales bacterium]|uniref:Lipoprotein n=1 Tax=Candidatus Thalassospirochaeta sargassi TaxID=3119039 RepID=A0AAJ1IA90_9SPIO|nr:hypothetical protein [Spirochaetales bacterium]
MKHAVKLLILIIAIVFALSSCQDVFTTSVFENLYEPDYETMSDEQKISYAEDLLATGSTEELEEAYDEITDLIEDEDIDLDSTELTDDELELVELAAELAIGASGIGDAVTDAIGTFASGEEFAEDDIMEIFESLETGNLEDAVGFFETLEANADEGEDALTDEQYTTAAAAQLIVVMEDFSALEGTADEVASYDDLDPDNNAVHAAIVEDLEQALEWADSGGFDASTFGIDYTVE